MGMPEITTTNTFTKTPLDDSTGSNLDKGGSYSVDSLPPHHNRCTVNIDNDTIMSELDTSNTGGDSEDNNIFAHSDAGMDDDPHINSGNSMDTELESHDNSSIIDLTIELHNEAISDT